ncbi:hypothetical protein [Aquimarina pacifica]|uniref:hypothetical protein n=1 Tax=Aquimarina pacifica TaxID=1296415 RepID=UPI00047111EC|nr:hypothetical protein [Aquimarina pacifica]
MKVIKDEDLLSLHYQIEKSEIKQVKLENLLKDESSKLKTVKKSNRLLGSLLLFFFLITVFLIANAFYSSKSSANKVNDGIIGKFSLLEDELEDVKEKFETLKNEKQDIQEIKDLYLYRSLIKKDTVYSVQLRTLGQNGISAISEKFTNALIYSDTAFYKMSLGVFETLPEAQEFRKALIASGGFSKRIFVISYLDGKRLKIENFQ